MGLLPDVGKEAVVVGSSREQLREHVLDVQSRVQVVTASTADQAYHLGASLGAGDTRYKKPGLAPKSDLLDGLVTIAQPVGLGSTSGGAFGRTNVPKRRPTRQNTPVLPRRSRPGE